MEKLIIIDESFHDKEVIGSIYSKKDKKLVLFFVDREMLIFSDIIQFELNFFSDQNILFEIKKYSVKDVPKKILEDFPFLMNYNKKQFFIFYCNSSIGISGIIVSKSGVITKKSNISMLDLLLYI